MNYQLVYDKLIDNARNRQSTGYTERHHVLPRCLGGTDDTDNLVRLTPREHFIAHKLLALVTNHQGLWWAVVNMTGSHGRGNNSKFYEKALRHSVDIRTKVGYDNVALKRGVFNMSFEQLSAAGKKGNAISRANGVGIHWRSKEKMSEDGRKGGLVGGKASTSIRWRCDTCGKETHTPGIVSHQKSTGHQGRVKIT